MEKVKTENTEVRTQLKETAPQRAIDKYKGRYTIKPSKTTWLEQIDKSHDGVTMFEGTFHSLCADRHKQTGLYMTGLTEQEARELEVEMGLKTMDLSPYSPYWGNFRINMSISREGLELNLERSALDKLRFCFAKASSKVALSASDALENPYVEYIMTSSEIEAKADNKKFKVKFDAVKKLGEMSIEDQMNFLKVFEAGRYKVGKSSTPDFIESTISKIVDEKPQAFIELTGNPDFKTMVFVQECILAGIVKKTGTKHYITGGDLIGNSFTDAVQNLQLPEYNEAMIGLKAKLQVTK